MNAESDLTESVDSVPNCDQLSLRRDRSVICFVDVVESMKFVQKFGPTGIEAIHALLRNCSVVAERQSGIILQTMGDGVMAEFPSSIQALRATRAMMNSMESSGVLMDGVKHHLNLRAGIHASEIFRGHDHIFGDGVSVASRVMGFASPGQVVVTAAAKEDVLGGIEFSFEDLGEIYLKHVEYPVHLYRLRFENVPIAKPPDIDQNAFLPVVAVVPFDSSVEADCQAAAAVVTEEICLQLAQLSSLRVISRFSLRAANSQQLSPQVLRTQFEVDFAISGVIRLFAEKLSVTFELIDTKSNLVLKTSRQVDKLQAVLHAESPIFQDICRQIMEGIRADGDAQLRSIPLPSLKSHVLLSAGISLLHRGGKESDGRSGELFDLLMERHRRSSSPYVWAAHREFVRVWRGMSSDIKKSSLLARQFSEQAIERNPEQGLPFAIRGMVASTLERDFSCALKYLETAVSKTPNEALAWIFKCSLHTFDGNGVLASQCAWRALQLAPFDPLSYYFKTLAAGGLVANRELESAIQLASQALMENAFHSSTYRVLAIAYGLNGQAKEGNDIVNRLLRLDPQFSISQFKARTPAVYANEYATALRFVGAPE